ncbi:MAG: prolyl oligopeptidase family serine peptidase [Pirellulales bacterium]|nr:prolyl oligopeptidase family serine peptidase [Pirellulales bacterium]
MTRSCFLLALTWTALIAPTQAADAAPKPDTTRGDRMIAEYFRGQTQELRDACLADVRTADDWVAKRGQYRRELLEMLGLDPMPEQTDLKAVVTGRIERDDFAVEKVVFQSSPGLYVTGNLYLPKGQKDPAPAILYLCGHGAVKKNGVSYGNKVAYHHHGCWFARHGYVCLAIDTVQLGEIEGVHHGTYRLGRWWWANRGYTPAGVEAWNAVRALDYLESRKEVDPKRLGATGRSGGGVYSWWIAAIDDRVGAVAPVAGITDLQNFVVDGCVEGHCDCMFMVNTYRWDYPQVAALAYPRPLLWCNSDSDHIFPLDGVMRSFEKVRRIYRLAGAGDRIGLVIVPGPHKDVQSIRVPVFAWMNKYLMKTDALIDSPAMPVFKPEELKVLDKLPEDQKNTRIDDLFVPAATARVPDSVDDWNAMRDGWRKALLEKSFRAWPAEPGDLDIKPAFSATRDGLTLSAYDFSSQEAVRLRLYVLSSKDRDKPKLLRVEVLDQKDWMRWLAAVRPGFEADLKDETLPLADAEAFDRLKATHTGDEGIATAYVVPRGVGPTLWNQDAKKNRHIRRRFMLLGQTLEGMQVWDVRRAMQALRTIEPWKDAAMELAGRGPMAGVALYASLFEPGVALLTLRDLPGSHKAGPCFLNVCRYLDMPQAVAMAAECAPVRLERSDETDWSYPMAVGRRLVWEPGRVDVVEADFESRVYKSPGGETLLYRLLAPPQDAKAADEKRPLLVFLHGAGERGKDNRAQLVHGTAMMRKAAGEFGCFVLAPQCPAEAIWTGREFGDLRKGISGELTGPMARVLELIDAMQKDRSIDPDRIYAMGLSMGGFATWNAAERYPERFAAIVPICGGGDAAHAARLAKLPIWAFHGGADPVVPVAASRDMIRAVEKAGGKPKYTEYPGVGHDSWTSAFAEPELLPWLLKQRRASP